MKRQKLPDIYYPQNALRRRAKLWIYFRTGLTKLPVAILILLFLMAGIVVTWKATVTFGDLITIPSLIPIFVYTLRITILLVVVLLFTAFIYLLGMPSNARDIENSIADAFEIEKTSRLYYRCPFLVSCKPVKGATAKEYVFWSKWIDVKTWNERKSAILWALQINSDEDFTAGKGKCTVTIRANSGVVPEVRETPQDPYFMS